MYRFEIIKSAGGCCVYAGSERKMENIPDRIYDAVLDVVHDQDEAIEASSWVEFYCGTIDDPALYDMDEYTLYFWED